MTFSVLPVLVQIQTQLDSDLSLARLADRAAMSRSHFHRRFHAETGETPKKYTQRLRLERAALNLCLHEGTVLDAALAVGFQNHETFTRAFKQQFGTSPIAVKRDGVEALRSRHPTPSAPDNITVEPGTGYQLSNTKLVTVKPMHLAFIRHLGPYQNVGDTIWQDLEEWARLQEIPGPRVLLGIGLDSPGITPDDKLRYDAALRVHHPFTATRTVGYQHFPGGRFAFATHVGHYSTLNAAYRRLVQRIARMKSVRWAGLPVIEMYHETSISVEHSLNHTDIYLPIIDQH